MNNVIAFTTAVITLLSTVITLWRDAHGSKTENESNAQYTDTRKKQRNRYGLTTLFSGFSPLFGFSILFWLTFGSVADLPLTGLHGALLAYAIILIFLGVRLTRIA